MPQDLDDSTIVITGGSSGIGAAAARILAERGARLVITGRSEQTLRVAEETGAEAHLVDFASLAAVGRLADTLLERHPRIDVLVNNAGGYFGKRRVTEDGNEMTLQVNHLAGFLLTERLRPRLEESRAVVINTSSGTQRYGRIDFEDLHGERRYHGFRQYARTKLMNILHAMEVDRRYDGVRAASFHPGSVATRIAREGGPLARWLYESTLRRVLMTSPEEGAETLVWLAEGTPGEDWAPGEYYVKRKPARTNPQADAGTARRLWDASRALLARAGKPG
jgi:NAD(P)-dependent dehydrogenase (short-subunit alcohol dehydrogenase family)